MRYLLEQDHAAAFGPTWPPAATHSKLCVRLRSVVAVAVAVATEAVVDVAEAILLFLDDSSLYCTTRFEVLLRFYCDQRSQQHP